MRNDIKWIVINGRHGRDIQYQQSSSEGGPCGNYVGPMLFKGLQYIDARGRMTKMAVGGRDAEINRG